MRSHLCVSLWSSSRCVWTVVRVRSTVDSAPPPVSVRGPVGRAVGIFYAQRPKNVQDTSRYTQDTLRYNTIRI